MNSGCICCSLVGDFGASLKEVISTYHPDRIIIEPSGVGKFSDVIRAVEDVKEDCDLELNSFTTVADVTKCKMYLRNFGEFFKNQLEYANTIILSRMDKTSQEKTDKAVELIREINQEASLITTPIAQLDGEKILEVMEKRTQSIEDMELPHEHEHHHDHEGMCSCGHEHHHEHEHHHDHEERAAAAMSITTSMSTTTITKERAAAATIIITTSMAIIMRMRCLPAGDGRRPENLTGRNWKKCWKCWETARRLVWCCGQRGFWKEPMERGTILIWFPERRRFAPERQTIPAASV